MSGKEVSIRFYEELNDFLPPDLRKVRFVKNIGSGASVKDLTESCGVPHTEVDLILVNGESENFDYSVKNKDDISVYPVFESIDISGVTKLQPEPLRNLRFAAGRDLGKLCRRLRLLGFDVFFDVDVDPDRLVKASLNEQRIILTRSRRLLMRKKILRGAFIRSEKPGKQVIEVVHRFDLVDSIKPFTRCLACNSKLHPVTKESVASRLQPGVKRNCDEFTMCGGCSNIYWKGSHFSRLMEFVEQVRREGAVDGGGE